MMVKVPDETGLHLHRITGIGLAMEQIRDGDRLKSAVIHGVCWWSKK